MFTVLAFAQLWIWLMAAGAHFWLTAVWLRRIHAAGSRDERWFEMTLVGVGALSLVLHAAAATTGLSLASGVIGLALWHGGHAWWLRQREPSAPIPVSDSAIVRWLEGAAMAVLGSIAFEWIVRSNMSLAVTGTDAAHYHVPVAVNLAQGASLFELPPTSHLYPMASSMLAAWFITPLQDALLVDSTMVLPFLLLASSIAMLFRVATGQSGLAWATWLTLVLFSTPMFRSASLMSADLLFTAGFVALMAQLARMWSRKEASGRDLILAGFATGLLAGAKTTGLVAAVLLWSVYVSAAFVRRRFRIGLPTGVVLQSALGAAVVAIGAGGLWLVRNWMLFGSPIAPTGLTIAGVTIFPGENFTPTTYLSVLESLSKDPAYSLASRSAHFVNQWFGAWFLPAMALALLVPIDVAVAFWRKRDTALASTRLAILVGLAAVGVPLVWLLIGAPWTSLEWTNGFALRYILPLLAILPVVAFIGLFPASSTWYTQPMRAAPAAILLPVLAFVMFLFAQYRDAALFLPRFRFNFALIFLVYALAKSTYRLTTARPVGIVLLALTPIVAGLLAWTDRKAQMTPPPASLAGSPARDIYAAVLRDEAPRSDPCSHRRFFVLTRLDDPLSLQDSEYRNRVYYAARDVALAPRYAPMGRCDYIITSRPVMSTDKGKALVTALDPDGEMKEIAESKPFVLLGR